VWENWIIPSRPYIGVCENNCLRELWRVIRERLGDTCIMRYSVLKSAYCFRRCALNYVQWCKHSTLSFFTFYTRHHLLSLIKHSFNFYSVQGFGLKKFNILPHNFYFIYFYFLLCFCFCDYMLITIIDLN